jgi:hypothetical protein
MKFLKTVAGGELRKTEFCGHGGGGATYAKQGRDRLETTRSILGGEVYSSYDRTGTIGAKSARKAEPGARRQDGACLLVLPAAGRTSRQARTRQAATDSLVSAKPRWPLNDQGKLLTLGLFSLICF